MREVERLFTVAGVAGGLWFGFRHSAIWFAIVGAALVLYVVIADRALSRQIGPRAWPSEGYARFAFNTNLYFAFCQLLLTGTLYALAGTISGMLAN